MMKKISEIIVSIIFLSGYCLACLLRKLRVLALIMVAVALTSCTTTCRCVSEKQLKKEQALLLEAKKQAEELRRLEQEIRRLSLECEAAKKTARINAERADLSRRQCENILIRLEAVRKMLSEQLNKSVSNSSN